MSNLLAALRNTAGAMGVFQRGMSVVQSNVTNASAPGYARQRQGLESMPSDLDRNLPGGVASSGTLSSRSAYAESSVRRQTSVLGSASERTVQLGALEPLFAIGASGGLGAAMNQLFQSFSALTVSPNDTALRQTALDRATALAHSFQQASAGLTSGMANADAAIGSQVQQLNSILTRLQGLNREFMNDFRAQGDSGLDAQLHTALEDLAQIADFTMLRNPNGTVSVYLGGQTAVLLGDRVFPVSAAPDGSGMGLFSADGSVITEQLSSGRLAALFDIRNTTIPGYATELDKLASTLADTVNATLAAGVDMNGDAPSTSLFSYSITGAARTLTVNALPPEALALASAGAPGGNGNAIALAALDQAKAVNGLTFAQFYGGIAAAAGRDLTSARQDQQLQQSLLLQTRDLRDQMSRVNLDEEALMLMEFQRAYQASAQLIRTIDEMLQTAMGILR